MDFLLRWESPSPSELFWSCCVVQGSREFPWDGGGSELFRDWRQGTKALPQDKVWYLR